MFIAISHNDPAPMYRQVTDQIRDAIARGDLLPDTRIPSIRELSVELGISPITIKRAYRDLESEGLIVTRAGLGSFIAAVDREEIRMEKLSEIRTEMKKTVRTAARYGISPEDIKRIIDESKED
ncbi:MAG TPA: GntR family transcriptional regulator [Candidatus Krumholzibacterium sp.]|nr:GntR family transcriptional regulator [Candidatus Krumholzibacterium sp.]